MKKKCLFVAALVCAVMVTAGIASAGRPKSLSASGQTVWAQQSPTPPYPTIRTPVAGYSPNFAAPQPATMATLERDANRLIRWEGWLDVDAFSVSILNQMQKQLEADVNTFTGSFTLSDPAIAAAVLKEKTSDPTFEMNPNLEVGVNFERTPTPQLYVWTYRHNFTDSGLYQLYVSVKGKIDIGTSWLRGVDREQILHKDIQSLNYEFGSDGSNNRPWEKQLPVFADIEIWRGAVAKVNAKGGLEIVGNEGGVIPNYPDYNEETVQAAPMVDWERAPSLLGNHNYNPQCATGAAFVEPLERAISINANKDQKRAGDVQKRVRTVTPFRYR